MRCSILSDFLEIFSSQTLCKLESRLCRSLNEDLESLKISLLTVFLERSVLFKFLVDISSSFARLSEGAM